MNKKIKVIDLIDKIFHKNNVPKRIKYKNKIWLYDNVEERYYLEDSFVSLAFETDRLNDEIEILEDNTEEIEELNAYKLMESPYMANLLKEQRYDEFMKLLKQSEVEIADKLIKLTWVVKEIRKDLNK